MAILAIHDLSCYSKSSLTVVIPVLEALGIETAVLPVSILSTQTDGFDDIAAVDNTEGMEHILSAYNRLGISFDGVYTGYLGDSRRIDIAIRAIDSSSGPVLVDPVMGDDGKLYPSLSDDLPQQMIRLVKRADIITPNLTEACILTDTPYKETWRISEIEQMAKALSRMGPEKIVVTGIPQRSFVANLCYEKGSDVMVRRTHRVGTSRSGTGDIFAAILAADAVNGVPFGDSVRKASGFIKQCIISSIERDIPLTDGVCFEEHLAKLAPRGGNRRYRPAKKYRTGNLKGTRQM